MPKHPLATAAVLAGAFGGVFWIAADGPGVAEAVQAGRHLVQTGHAPALLGLAAVAGALAALRGWRRDPGSRPGDGGDGGDGEQGRAERHRDVPGRRARA